MSQYKCGKCGEKFNMNKPTNFALALKEHHDCPEYEYEDEDDGFMVRRFENKPAKDEDESLESRNE